VLLTAAGAITIVHEYANLPAHIGAVLQANRLRSLDTFGGPDLWISAKAVPRRHKAQTSEIGEKENILAGF
jgi:hypothetical protein